MNISIIGSGNMAHGIGTRIVGHGHTLTIYDRKPEEAKELATKLGEGTQSKDINEPFEGDIIILALPYGAISEVVTAHREQLAGKVVIDISNPVNFDTFQLIPPAGSSGAEEIAKLLPDTRLVKAFNTTFSGTLLAGQVAGQKLDVFIAGDNQEAKDTVREIVEASGMRAIDAGPLAHARHLEGFQLIHMASQEQLGSNWQSVIKFLQ